MVLSLGFPPQFGKTDTTHGEITIFRDIPNFFATVWSCITKSVAQIEMVMFGQKENKGGWYEDLSYCRVLLNDGQYAKFITFCILGKQLWSFPKKGLSNDSCVKKI
jgi:hypothetical protein